jgi:uncharacterized membrane protein YqjE
MDTHAPGASGLLGSLRGFADGVVASVHDRVELLSVELQEEKHRLVQTFIWISAIVFLAMLALTFASFAIVVLLWETARVTVVVGLAVLYIVALIGAVIGFKRFLARQPKPFAATLGELKQDRECIRPES